MVVVVTRYGAWCAPFKLTKAVGTLVATIVSFVSFSKKFENGAATYDGRIEMTSTVRHSTSTVNIHYLAILKRTSEII